MSAEAGEEHPAPTFVGFFPKLSTAAPEMFQAIGVETIASVSRCISAGPPDWIDSWSYNALGFYDTEAGARSIVPPGDPYDLYAYEVFPLRAAEARLERFTAREAPGGVPADFELLGFDIVSRSTSDFFECSPLSCNQAAMEGTVNRFCLLPHEGEAWEWLRRIAREGSYEPGPYYLFRVWRKILG